MKQLGLSSTETGILLGLMPFISFFIIPAFGAVADKTGKPKAVLIICLLFTGLFHVLLLVVPSKSSVEVCSRVTRVIIGCDAEGTYIIDPVCIFPVENDFVSYDNLYTDLTDFKVYQIKLDYTPYMAKLFCNKTLSVSTQFQKTVASNSSTKKDVNSICQLQSQWPKENGKKFEYEPSITGLYNKSENDLPRYRSPSIDLRKCQIFYWSNNSRFQEQVWNLTCQDNKLLDCILECNKSGRGECVKNNNNDKSTFWIFSGIFLFANIFFAPISSLMDSMAYDILGAKRSLWGKQRLWGTFGFALFAIISTMMMHVKKISENSVDYSVSFYICLGLCILSSITVVLLHVSENLQCRQMLQNVKLLLCLPKIAGFLSVITVISVFHFAITGFLFWYLEDLGSNQIIFGVCLFINSFSEIIMLFIAGKIIESIGHIPCLYLAVLAYAVRFASYSFLNNAWFILPVELLHGVCFGLMYAAASAYASIISPAGMSATVQGLMGGLYFGFGKYTGTCL